MQCVHIRGSSIHRKYILIKINTLNKHTLNKEETIHYFLQSLKAHVISIY